MGDIVLAGATSGTITLQPTAVAGSNTLTLPAANATLATLTTPSFASTIGVGGATAAASGAGITFPATQSASTDANTLDDYEEGTWTPTLVPATGTITSQTGAGLYVKIGRVVTCMFNIRITGGTVTAIQSVSNLPFTVNASINDAACCAREWYATGNLWAASFEVSGTKLYLNRYDNSTTVVNNYGWAGSVTYITG